MQQNYFGIIPANVRYDKNIPPNAKLLYSELTALSNQEGFCWAGNEYFSELYNVTKESISGWISKLKRAGYIDVELTYRENSKQIEKRKIYITPHQKIMATPPKNNGHPHQNILVVNKTSIKSTIKTIDTKVSSEPGFKLGKKKTLNNCTISNIISEYSSNMELRTKLTSYVAMLKQSRKTNISLVQFRELLVELNELCKEQADDTLAIQIVQQSIRKGWNGFYAIDTHSNSKRGTCCNLAEENIVRSSELSSDEYEKFQEGLCDEQF